MENIFIEFLPPWVETGIQPAFYDKESGTCLQQTARMYAKVNELIKAYNDFTSEISTTVEDFTEDIESTVEEYIGKFEDLYDYVHDYFDNLDVQEEIDNKLDEMADEGELTDLIIDYLNVNTELCYDTVADMKVATNLVAGSYAKTYGYHAVNDKGGAFYKVRTIAVSDTPDDMFIIELADNTLVAELIEGEKLNIRQIGAYGDNTHDDSDVIQAGLDHAKTTVFFPSGNYLTTKKLTVSSANTRVEFNGRARLYASDDSFTGDSVIELNNSFITLEKAYIVSHDATETRSMIHITSNGYQVTVRDCITTGTGLAGLEIDRTEARVYNCTFRQTKFGIECNDDDLYIEDVTCELCTQDGLRLLGGAAEIHHLHAIQCVRYGIYISSGAYSDLYGCCSDTCGETGYEIRNSSRINLFGCWALKCCQTEAGYDFHVVNCESANMVGCRGSGDSAHRTNSFYIQSGLVKLDGCFATTNPLFNRANARVINCFGNLQKWNQKNINTYYLEGSVNINGNSTASLSIPINDVLPTISTAGVRGFKFTYIWRSTDNTTTDCGEIYFTIGDGSTGSVKANTTSDVITISSPSLATVDGVQTMSITANSTSAKNGQLGAYVEYLGTSRVQN